MKKTAITAFVVSAMASLSGFAASTIAWDFGTLNVGPDPLADGSAVYLFVSTTGAATDLTGLETSLVGLNLGIGSVFGGDKVVIGVSTPNIASFGVAGTGNDTASNISYTGGISENDALGILFINQAPGVIGAGVEFGIFTSGSLLMPADGSTVSRSFLEVGFGGTIPDGGIATTNVTIPEPSVALLGAFGILALLRRRR